MAEERRGMDRCTARQETAGHHHLLRAERSYRQIIIGDRREVRLVYLRGGKDLVAEHLAGRKGHFMPASLLASQIDTLEEPNPSEDPLIVDEGAPAGRTPGQIAEEIIHLLGASATITSDVTPARESSVDCRRAADSHQTNCALSGRENDLRLAAPKQSCLTFAKRMSWSRR